MKIRKIISAGEGKILTNGEIYGRVIALAEGVSEADFYEITEGEYNAILDSPEVKDEDYREALKRLGVNFNA